MKKFFKTHLDFPPLWFLCTPGILLRLILREEFREYIFYNHSGKRPVLYASWKNYLVQAHEKAAKPRKK